MEEKGANGHTRNSVKIAMEQRVKKHEIETLIRELPLLIAENEGVVEKG